MFSLLTQYPTPTERTPMWKLADVKKKCALRVVNVCPRETEYGILIAVFLDDGFYFLLPTRCSEQIINTNSGVEQLRSEALDELYVYITGGIDSSSGEYDIKFCKDRLHFPQQIFTFGELLLNVSGYLEERDKVLSCEELVGSDKFHKVFAFRVIEFEYGKRLCVKLNSSAYVSLPVRFMRLLVCGLHGSFREALGRLNQHCLERELYMQIKGYSGFGFLCIEFSTLNNGVPSSELFIFLNIQTYIQKR